ncbi:unnamed protein product [Amoebophrya sp. A120]|nr:unnamed protein product [Amoebophrya sp. A120]|eukprot:GSA120T00010345001.1
MDQKSPRSTKIMISHRSSNSYEPTAGSLGPKPLYNYNSQPLFARDAERRSQHTDRDGDHFSSHARPHHGHGGPQFAAASDQVTMATTAASDGYGTTNSHLPSSGPASSGPTSTASSKKTRPAQVSFLSTTAQQHPGGTHDAAASFSSRCNAASVRSMTMNYDHGDRSRAYRSTQDDHSLPLGRIGKSSGPINQEVMIHQHRLPHEDRDSFGPDEEEELDDPFLQKEQNLQDLKLDLQSLFRVSKQQNEAQKISIQGLQVELNHANNLKMQLEQDNEKLKKGNDLLIQRCNALVSEMATLKTNVSKTKQERDKLEKLFFDLKQKSEEKKHFLKKGLEEMKQKLTIERRRNKHLASALRSLQRDFFVEKMRRNLAEES